MENDYAKYLLNRINTDYNLIAEDFSRTRGNVWPEISFLFEDIKPEDKILDLGCGNGRYYSLLKNAQYTGIDNSESLVNLARRKHPEANFQIQDALNLNFKDNAFDKIYSIAVLHHIPSCEFRLKFLSEAKRVLKPNGRIILTVWKFHQKKEILLLLKYTVLKLLGFSKLDFKDILEPWSNKALRYYHWFSKRELGKLFEKSGFKIIQIDVIKNGRGNRQNIYVIARKVF